MSRAQVNPGAAQDSHKSHILIVDDENTVLLLLAAVLTRDYSVTAVDNPRAAIEAVRKRRPDVIICDIRMPDHDGFWVIAEVRKIDPTIPVILHSAYHAAYAHDDVRDTFRPFGFLKKGASLRELHQIVDEALKSVVR